MRPRLPAALILALALLVATQGALLHPLSHAGEYAHTNLAGDARDAGDGDNGAHQACELCLAFSAVVAAAPPGAALQSVALPRLPQAGERHLPRLPQPPPAFRSRAPPALS